MNNLETNNTQATEQQEAQESNGVAMNLFAILGFIAILLAGLWATVQLVKQVSNFSFDFNKPSISLFGNSGWPSFYPSSTNSVTVPLHFCTQDC